jgi:nucleoid-associated protein YgaU
MGLFDSIKNSFGKGAPPADVTTAPSQVLREAGLDPSGLKFGFGNQSITVSGTLATESDRQKILDVLAALPGIESVEDQMTVAVEPAPQADSPEPAPQADSPEPPGEPADDAGSAGERSYTVVSGDTLWKISAQMYGEGSQYMKIFEANTDVLEHPDRIFPGQVLRIPNL